MGINISTYNPTTETLGVGNSIKKTFNLSYKAKSDAGGMSSIIDFKNYCNNGERRGKIRLLNRLNNYKKQLEISFGISIDPIEYLLFLYFEEGKSIKDIFDTENNQGLNYKDEAGIGKLFKDTFSWNLRDTTGSKLTKKKREAIKDKQVSGLKNSNLKKSKEKRKLLVSKTKDFVDNILGPLPTFIKEDFLNKRNKTEKIIYTLKSLNGMGKKHIKDLYKSGLGSRILADYFGKLINNFLKKYSLKIKIFPKDILAVSKK